MQNQNGEENIINKELLPLIEYAKWELYHFNLLKKSSKVIKSELILIEREVLKKWKEKSGYNIFKKQIFSHIFTLNKLKNMNDKIQQEKENINTKWQKAIRDKIINPNSITTLPITDLSGLYLSLKYNKINAYKKYEIISSKLYYIFKKFINYKIIVEGFYHNGKLIIPMNYKNEINLRTSIKSGENFLEIIYLNNKNETEDMLCVLPNDEYICRNIEDYYINESIDNLINNIFSHMDKNDNKKFITDFIDDNGNKVQYKIINKKDNTKNQIHLSKNNINEKNNDNEIDKLKSILNEKIKILKEVNQRINQKNNNLMKLKLNHNITDLKYNVEKQKLDDIKNKYLNYQKEYEKKQKELETTKQSLKNSDKSFQSLNPNDLKLNINNNYLLQEKKIKEKEDYLIHKEKELNLREKNIRKKELEINEEKLDILNKEEELDQKLKEINDKLILMKNKSYLMNIQEKEKEKEKINISQDNNNDNKEINEIDNELEKEISILNNSKNDYKKSEDKIDDNSSNKFKSLNSINFSKNKSPRISNSPQNIKYKRANTIAPNMYNLTENNNNDINTERLSMKFNINLNRTKTLNNNNISPSQNQNKKRNINPKINQTETKINKNIPSLGLEQIDYPNNINAVLQCLAHIPELAEGILELGYKEKYFKENQNVELSRNFASIVNNLFFPLKYNNKSRIYSPKNFVDTFNQMCPLINEKNPPRYMNINDMIKFILDTFHSELNIKKMNSSNEFSDLKEGNKIDLSNEKDVLVKFLTKFTNNNNSLISKLFFGLTKAKYVCNECGNTKYDFDYYNYLYFDLPKIKKHFANDKSHGKIIGFLSLNDCLDYQRRTINIPLLFNDINLFILEKFGINRKSGKAFCEQCQEETQCSLNNYLYSSNTILPIILERGNDDNYLIEDIKFPNELNLENYIEFNKSVKKYYLCGVVSNLGKNNILGKFVSYCKMTYNGKWYKYHNEKSSSCTLDDIYKEGVPYMLIYHKI